MTTWNEITFFLQSQFGSANLHSSLMASLSYGDSLGMDSFDLSSTLQAEDSSQPSSDTLDSLNELAFLATVHRPPTPSPTLASASSDTYSYPDAWLWDQSESPSMGLLQVSPQRNSYDRQLFSLLFMTTQLGLQTLNTSDSSHANDVSSFDFVDTQLTVNLASISPPPVGVFDLSPITTTASSRDISLDFPTPASDGAVSPVSFSQSLGVQQNFTDAAGPFSFRRHSFGAARGDPPPRVVGQKTKRDGDDVRDDYDYNYSPTAAAGTHTSKRRRAAVGGTIVQATSAPARFTVPLPNVEHAHHEKNDCDDDDGSSSISSSSQSSLTLTTPLSMSASLFPSPAPAARASRRGGRRRAGTSGGRVVRTPRTPCEYCPKTFTRAQDAQRHAAASCPENPNREGVRCPECGEVLSRSDSAQRHYRGHKNPQSEPPASWVDTRA
jgi:hypothetical protein